MGLRKLLPLMMSLCLLTACGGESGGSRGEELALQIRTDLLSMTGCTGRVSLTADYGQRVFDCVLDFTWDRETGGGVTVVEPELAAGLGARFGENGLTISYDTVSLETGPLTPDGLSPLEALPTFYRLLTGGYIAACTPVEDGVITVTYREGDRPAGAGLEGVVTFDADARAPVSGELFYDGNRVIRGEIQNFQMKIGEN